MSCLGRLTNKNKREVGTWQLLVGLGKFLRGKKEEGNFEFTEIPIGETFFFSLFLLFLKVLGLDHTLELYQLCKYFFFNN